MKKELAQMKAAVESIEAVSTTINWNLQNSGTPEERERWSEALDAFYIFKVDFERFFAMPGSRPWRE